MPFLEGEASELGGIYYMNDGRSMRAVKGSLGRSFKGKVWELTTD